MIILGGIGLGLLLSCSQPSTNETSTNSDSTAVSMEHSHNADTTKTAFGAEKVDTSMAITTAQLIENFNGKTELDTTFQGQLAEVCSKEGCWIRVKNGENDPIMVRFKNHFTIPTSTPIGTKVYLTGKAIQDTISVERQKHLLEDANASEEEIAAVKAPKYTMTFVADGIQLVK